jgi:hypothetical protein
MYFEKLAFCQSLEIKLATPVASHSNRFRPETSKVLMKRDMREGLRLCLKFNTWALGTEGSVTQGFVMQVRSLTRVLSARQPINEPETIGLCI